MTSIKRLSSNKIKVDKEKCLLAISIVTSFISLFFLWKLCETISLVYIDDVMYADWTKHGISHFFERINWHWNEFNGRTLIHILLSLTLIFEEHLYAIVLPLSVHLGILILYRIAKPNSKLYEVLFAGSLVCLGLAGLHPIYSSNSIIWMAGGFNYYVPVLFIAIGYLLYNKAKENNKFIIPTFISLLLIGGITEQYGMCMIGLIVLSTFFDIIDKKKENLKKNLLFLGITVASYITIFLSPGTNTRVNDHTVGFQGFWSNFLDNNEWLNGYVYIFIPVILILFSFLGFTKKYKPLLFSLPVAVLYFLFSCVWRSLPLTALLLFVYMAFVCIVLLKNKDTRECGKFLTCGYGMFFMISITQGGFRTCIPFVIMLYLVLAILYFDILIENKNKIKYLYTGILALFIFSLYINSQQYIAGFEQMSKDYIKPMYNSFVNAKETNKVDLDFDYIDRTYSESWYRYYGVVDLGEWVKMEDYKSYYGYSDDITYNHISKHYDVSNVFYEGKSYMFPVVNEDGKHYVSYKILTCKNKGQVGELESIPAISVNNETCNGYWEDQDTYVAISNNGGIISMDNNKLIYLDKQIDFTIIPTKTTDEIFIDIEAFCKATNTSYTYDEHLDTFFITENKQEVK